MPKPAIITLVAALLCGWQLAVCALASELYIVRCGGRCGFISALGEMRVQPKYLRVTDEDGTNYVAQRHDRAWVLVRPDGTEQPLYDGDAFAVRHMGDTLYAVHFGDDRPSEIVDLRNTLVLPEGYQPVSGAGLSEGLIAVTDRDFGKCGYIDRRGRFIIEPQFDSANDFSEGLAAVELERKFGFINRAGEVVIPTQFVLAGNFSDGLAWANEHARKRIFIDRNGKPAFPASFTTAYNFTDGLAGVLDSESNLWGFVDTTGQYVIPPQYSNLYPFLEGLAFVELPSAERGEGIRTPGPRWQFIDRGGKMAIILLEGGESYGFQRGLAWIEQREEPVRLVPRFGDLDYMERYNKGYYIDARGLIVWRTSDCGSTPAEADEIPPGPHPTPN